MNENYYDETVSMHEDVRTKKKAKVLRFKIYGIVLIVLAFIFFFLFMFNPVMLEEGQELEDVNINIWALIISFILPAIIFLVGGFLFLVFRKKIVFEFDYSFVDGNVRIAKIFNGMYRRGLIAFNCPDIVTIGKVDGDDCKKYESMHDIKFVLATPNLDVDNSNIYYAIIHDEMGRTMLYFEPSVRLLTDMRKSAGRNIFGATE